jgi:hypothetical protein
MLETLLLVTGISYPVTGISIPEERGALPMRGRTLRSMRLWT